MIAETLTLVRIPTFYDYFLPTAHVPSVCADFVVGVFLVVCGNDNRFATHSSRRRISLSLVTVSGQKRSLNHSCRSGALQAYCWPHEMVIPVLFVAAPIQVRIELRILILVEEKAFLWQK